jgi:hypothetical protein
VKDRTRDMISALSLQPASTAPLAAGLPIVQGRCPACGRASLFLGNGGHVTCSIIDCPNPSEADDLLHGEEPAPAATEATDMETTARVFAGLHRSAEQDVTRVIELYERWVTEGAPPLGVPIARWWDKRLVELRDAIRSATDQPKEQP